MCLRVKNSVIKNFKKVSEFEHQIDDISITQYVITSSNYFQFYVSSKLYLFCKCRLIGIRIRLIHKAVDAFRSCG